MSNNRNRNTDTNPLRKIKFAIEELDGKTVVKMENETEGMQSSKTVQLKAFIDYITEYNKDKVVNDSGFLPPNLVRKVTRGSREMCVYFFPQLIVSPAFYAARASNYRLLEAVQSNLKDDSPVKIVLSDETDHDDDDEDYREDKFIFKDLVVNNIVLTTTFDANSHYLSYNVFHALKEDSIFSSATGPYESINEDTKLIRSIFPNHYDSAICWGNINLVSGLSDDFKRSNYSVIRNIPFNYLNSIFNNDLFGSGHNSNSEGRDFRSVPSELKDKVIDFYYNNLSENSGMTRSNFRSRFNDSVVNSDSRLLSNVGALIFFAAPILGNGELYDEYFRHISTRQNTRTVKQYLEGNSSND